MKTDLYSISKIFTERLLRIPDYQRGYAWREKHLKDYWNDLIQIESDKNHYIGVLTLEDVPESVYSRWVDDTWIIEAKNYAPFYIVDGQQRLTTTIILIQAITESINENDKINFNTIDEIRKKYLFDSKDEGVSRSYIFGYEKDNPSYEFLKCRIFNERSDTSYPIQETIYTHNLEYAKTYFIELLNELPLQDIEKIYATITQKFLFNIYAISNDIDVFIAFETMNNRGKLLSHLELLKNRLIYLSTKFNVESYEKDNLRKIINESWKSVYHYLGKNKLNPLDDDLFLENHFLLYFGDILDQDVRYMHHMTRLRRSYRYYHKDYLLEEKFTAKNINANTGKGDAGNSLTVTDIKQYAKSLKDSVEIWYQILNPKDSTFSKEEKFWLEKLNRLSMEDVAPLVMVFFQNETNKQNRIKLLKSIENNLFFLSLVRRHYTIDFDSSTYLGFATKLARKDLTPTC